MNERKQSPGMGWDEPTPKKRRRKKRPKKKHHGRSVIPLLILLLLINAAIVLYYSTEIYYVVSVKLNDERLDLFVGESVPLDYECMAFGKGEGDFVWSSSDETVIAVSGSDAAALSPGSVTVTLSERGSGRQDSCLICVYDTDEIVLGDDAVKLGVGETNPLEVRMGASNEGVPLFESSDDSVASVSGDGVITALSPGEATVTVSARGFEDKSCTVTVMAAPTELELLSGGGLCMGEKRQLVISMSDLEYSSSYTYKSDAPDVCSVDEQGVVTGVAKGTASISVAAGSGGASATLEVTVGDAPKSLTVPKKLTVSNGLPKSLNAADNTGCCREFYYASSAPDIVTVDEQGNVFAVGRGEAVVTCTGYNGVSAECKVKSRIVDYTVGYTSERVAQNIAALAAQYPEFIAIETIGQSVQGKDIALVRLGTGERKVCIVAGMHARECISTTFTMRCVEEYAAAAAAGKKYNGFDVKKLLGQYTLYIVPLLNPDGLDIYEGLGLPEYTTEPLSEDDRYEYKNNANGVNLNRNFPFLWGEPGVNIETPDARSYAGGAEQSEPETQAIVALCEANEFEWLLDMHCKGHMIYYQDKHNKVTKRDNNMAYRLFKRYEFELLDRSTAYEISGGLENWFRSLTGNPGICVELVPSKYSPVVNKYFEDKVMWAKTRVVFLDCLGM